MNMKSKYVCGVLLGLVAALSAAGAGENSQFFSVYTVPEDRYADGTVVKDGEYYTLTWQKDDWTFDGFTVDGTPVSPAYCEVLWQDSAAENGCLEERTFTFDTREHKSFEGGGRFALYLLDTRKFAEPTVSYDAAGNVASVTTNATLAGTLTGAVQGFVEVAGFIAPNGSVVSGTSAGKPFLLSTLDNTRVENPVVTGIRVDGDDVVLTVSSTTDAVVYNAAVGATPADARTSAVAAAHAPVSGASTADGTIELRIPRDKQATHQFFKVMRNPMK